MTFGETLRQLMAERGISQRRLAKLVPCNDGYLSRVAHDEKVPSDQMAERLDDLLDAGGQLAALRSPSPWGMLNGSVSADDSERLALAVARPARLDTATLDALGTVLSGQRRLEDAIGPAALLRPISGQLDAITAMLRDARGPLAERLGRVVAEWSVYAGWLHAALRRDGRALELLTRGEDLADEFDDGTIAAIATSFRGYVARQQGRARAVVRASMAAMATPGGHPVQATFDRLQAAQGYAVLGEDERARRLLDEAASRAADAVEPPPPVYWYSRPFFDLNIGVVLLGIGEHSDAAALLAEGLSGIPDEQTGAEWLGEYRAALEEAREHS
ncbi:helix-turn-helix domain-containing protein [Actinomadura welshii]